MAVLETIPEPGQIVKVRERNYVVTNIEKSKVPKDRLTVLSSNTQHLLTLSSIEEDALSEEIQVIWEIEPGTSVFEKIELPEPTGFDDPTTFNSFLNSVRWGAISQADSSNLQSPFRSGIAIEDYQLEPLVRALRMPRVNLLIADDVGLGKTVEAGLVAQELILRHRVRSILIVCGNAGLQVQWKEEMRDKFGLEFRIVDNNLFRDLRRKRGIHVNPWTHFPRLITSIDFIKRDRPLSLFLETLPSKETLSYPRRYDLLIVDEAHNIAPTGSKHFALDSQRTQAIRQISNHFEHKMFLTATPHNGYQESFSALLEILDNQRFARGVKPDLVKLKEDVLVRRLKSDLKKNWDGSPRFPERKIKAIAVPYSDEEKKVHKLLNKYTDLRLKNTQNDTQKYTTEFVLKLLKKRLFSSPAAFLSTLEKHEQTLLKPVKVDRQKETRKGNIGILRKQVENLDDEFENDEEYENATFEYLESFTRQQSEPTQEELNLLSELKTYAARASKTNDSKAKEFVKWIKKEIKPNDKWSDTRVIIFTEYRTTQKWLQELLSLEGLATKDRLMVLYGGMDTEDRENIKAAFQTDPKESTVRILLATDAASEGINLQNYCSKLIHYEIPWNPNRMEQRNGRVDRHGQKAKEVEIFHFVDKDYQDTDTQYISKPGELEGDLEFLFRAVKKVEKIREDLGKVGPVIANQVEEAMLGHRKNLDTTKAEEESKPIKRLLTIERNLQTQIEKYYEQLQETKTELQLTPKNIQEVVELGLKLAGQPPLQEAHVESVSPVFHLPELKGSWAKCLEGINHPHTGVRRPIVFDQNLIRGREDLVLVHLNHRLVTMCLTLLRAEIWSRDSYKNLHRFTAMTIPDKYLETPAVIAHGRLLVLGGDNQRLHEEIIQSGGYIREGRFARFESLTKLNEIMNAAMNNQPQEATLTKLVDLWPKLSESLLKALEVRMNERADGINKKLKDREEKEINDIKAVLNELKKAIESELDEHSELDGIQLQLWSDPEKDQFQKNINSLKLRLNQIPKEMEEEEKSIRKRFANPDPRLFPLAVTFVIPESIARKMGG